MQKLEGRAQSVGGRGRKIGRIDGAPKGRSRKSWEDKAKPWEDDAKAWEDAGINRE